MHWSDFGTCFAFCRCAICSTFVLNRRCRECRTRLCKQCYGIHECQLRSSGTPFCRSLVETEDGALMLKFQLFQKGFVMRFHGEIQRSIAAVLQGAEFKLVPLSETVKTAFVGHALGNESSACVVPTLHGTSAENLASIRKHGLLVPGTTIPGTSTILGVAHGSAAGIGIYTAGLHAPDLSRGFCTTRPTMFVCAVVLKPSEVIQHHDAYVCRDARCVVPVLEVIGKSFVHPTSRPLPHQLAPARPSDLFTLAVGATPQQMREAGIPAAEALEFFSVADVLELGYPAMDLEFLSVECLRRSGATPQQMRKAGISAEKLLKVFPEVKVLELGYPAKDLEFLSVEYLQESGAIPQQMRKAGISAEKLLKVFPDVDVLELGYPAMDLMKLGFSAFALHSAGYTGPQLRDAKIPAGVVLFLEKFGLHNVPPSEYLGFAAIAGYPALNLRQHGYRARELKANGYTWEALFHADFDSPELREAGAEFRDFNLWRPGVVKEIRC